MSIYNRASSRLSPEYALLGFLYRLPTHGYELHQRMEEEFGNIWHTSQSQTYNILKRLESQGYIRSTSIEQDKHPAKLLLHITSAGSERFEDWLEKPTKSSVHAIRVEFITRMYFTQLYFPAQVPAMLQAQLDTVEAGLPALQRVLERTPESQVYNRLAVQLRLNLLQSVIHWLNECRETLATAYYTGGSGE